jgi:eukaryotic-like serine/threonine-protein kinase
LPPVPRRDYPPETGRSDLGDSDETAGDSDLRGTLPRSTLFVGREREFAELSGGLSDTLGGHGRVFLIVGEPGIGKTRLASEVGEQAERRGARVLWGRCWEGEGAPPYWPWVQVLRSYLREADPETIARQMGSGAPYMAQIVPEVRERLGALPSPPTSLESEHARFCLFDAITTLLTKAAETKPLVLTLDDLHWADRASLLLLQFVAHELRHARILILGTYREAEVRQAAEVMNVLAVVGRDAHHIPLRGLSEAEVGKVIEAIAGHPASAALTRTVRQATEGNPFFVDELARLLAAEGRIGGAEALATGAYPVPQGVREAIRRRLKPLSEESRRVLSVACVVGREFDVAILQQVCELQIGRLLALLGEVLAAGMVVETSAAPGRFSFSHALVRETLYDDLAPGERASLHRRVGEALEGLYGTNPQPHLAELAHHFLRAGPAGDWGKAIDYAIRAGRRARRELAYEEGAAHFQRAVELMERQGSPDQTRLCAMMLELGEAQWESADAKGARRTFLLAAELAENLRVPELLARAALGYGGLEASWGKPIHPPHSVEVDLLERALAASLEGDDVLRARLMARLGAALTFSPEQARMKMLMTQAVELARRGGDKMALIDVLKCFEFGVVGTPDRAEERIAVDTEIIQLAGEVGERSFALMARNHRLHCRLQLGRTEGLDREFDELIRDLSARRQAGPDWGVAMIRTMRALLEGRLEEAEELSNRALAIGQRDSPSSAAAAFGMQMAFLRREQGRLDEVIEPLRLIAERGSAFPVFRCSLAWAYAELGRHEDARGELEPLARDGFAQLPRDMFWLVSMGALCETVALLHDTPHAESLYEALRPFAGQVIFQTTTVCTGSASRPLGLLAAVLGRFDDAERHFEDALEMNLKLRAAPWLAHTRHEYASMLLERDRAGDSQRAFALLGQAIDTARALGMKSLLEKAEALKAGARGLRAVAAPDGTVTLMFSDMEGFTEMTERLGDAAALEVARAHNKIVRDQLKVHGGSELELQGDGFLLAFPKAGSALLCAIAIQRALAAHSVEHPDQPIRVRIGIHSGEPIKEADRFFGKSVILAARIAAQAKGGEILVSSVVRDLSEGTADVRFDSGREVELKGLAGKRRVFRALWSDEDSSQQPVEEAAPAPTQGSVFRREGDYWTIVYEGKAFRLKDAKGLRYVAELLRNPGRELHVTALVGAAQPEPSASGVEHAEAGLQASGLGDAGEILDAQAKAQYGRRLEDLRESLAEAERFNDQERAARARAEIELLSHELASAVGLGGRDRKAASAVERARLNVTLAIKAALRRIAENSPSFGQHLQTTLRTGKFCSYTPDPRVPISWTF